MKPKSYWKKRSEQIGARQFKKADDYERVMLREYKSAQQSIQRDIEAFYGRFAKNNQVSIEDARKLLTKGELSEFRMTLKEFTDKAKNNADGRWTQQLNNVYYKTRVSRFEALQVQINQHVEMLTASRQAGTQKLLGDVYLDTYYRTMHEIQSGMGVGSSFARLDDDAMKKILGTKLDGRNWSQRVWDDRTKLKQELHTKLSQSMIRGDSVDRMSRDIADRMGVSLNRARTLVQTETAFFTDQATMDSYKESGVVEKYEILATLDNRTSSICQSMDGKVFKLSEMEVGVSYPPFHPNCRTTTIPYFEDYNDSGERAARDENGTTYYVPADTTYEEWKKQHVDSQNPPERDIIEPNFSKVVSNIPNAPLDYVDKLKDRYSNGSDAAQAAINRYVTDDPIADGRYKKGAHYDPNDQKVRMNLDEDSRGPQEDGSVFYHEIGHMVDNLAGAKFDGSQSRFVSTMAIGDVAEGEFRQAILSDVRPYIIKVADEQGVSMNRAMVEVGNRFRGDNKYLYSSVSDIYGGVTNNQAAGDFGHPASYWKKLPNALEKEAFAHMFEASFSNDEDRRKVLEEYLPKSYAVFKRILEVL